MAFVVLNGAAVAAFALQALVPVVPPYAVPVNVGATLSILVMVRDVVEVLPQASVNVHDSVNEPPQAVWLPEITPITEPLIRHDPERLFV